MWLDQTAFWNDGGSWDDGGTWYDYPSDVSGTTPLTQVAAVSGSFDSAVLVVKSIGGM